MKRTPIRRVSAKRRAAFTARRAVMKVVGERDKVCQFPGLYRTWRHYHRSDEFPGPVSPCFGSLHGHEPRKLSHYPEDYLDPERIVLLCNGHNDWCEDWPNARKLLGL